MKLIHLLSICGLLTLGVSFAAAGTPPSRAERPIDIATARALPLGTSVTVDGSVTVPSGAYSSSTFDQGFALQDKTGGIFVSIATDLHLTVRQQARVTGQKVSVTGLSYQFGDYEVDPRFQSDIRRRED